MDLPTQLTKFRRFLRDPNANVYSDDQLMSWWNEAQQEIYHKTHLIEGLAAIRYPQEYYLCYQNDWEREHCITGGDLYQTLLLSQITGDVLTAWWEAHYYAEDLEQTDGYRLVHPWEIQYASPSDVYPLQIPDHAGRVRYAAYDKRPIDPITERELQRQDDYYKTRQGEVVNYWRLSPETNQIVLYPRPGTIVPQFDSLDTSLGDTYTFEDDQNYNFVDSGDYIFVDGSVDDYAVIASDESVLTTMDTGFNYEPTVADDALFMVYETIPRDIDNWSDSVCDYPAWMWKYIMYGALERAFGADTDAFVPSLRDLWQKRKEVGINLLLKYKRMRDTSNQVFQMGGGMRSRPKGRGGSLGQHYPAI